jgi:hypothetical protein
MISATVKFNARCLMEGAVEVAERVEYCVLGRILTWELSSMQL